MLRVKLWTFQCITLTLNFIPDIIFLINAHTPFVSFLQDYSRQQTITISVSNQHCHGSVLLTAYTAIIQLSCNWAVYISVMPPMLRVLQRFVIDQLDVRLIYSLKCKKRSTHSMEINAGITRLHHFPPLGSLVSTPNDGCG